mmetsp:Transcript_11343/g.12960  ORF Transcript_11343/g.12960 Transcript_11343/m.12960 type:complete len:523 (+) Transcript_11343:28-1596(+)|eukprot:CAMPEP_0176444216 /NCGR_PEP_ID=MMETSP0127-20121128/22925_1 /TAXON_ID=938130 /ORGANISM="Platyophrya macrostoma, Strain WH" /LENGTH=522 /DNA_ID=CAMNT_0017829671 /DNA_START=3 /DNA_END=1571 /DNA_ORIENTATION=-
MKTAQFLFIGLILLASSVAAEKLSYDEGVLILTDENHDLALSLLGTVIIDFYTPTCEHCKTLEPEYVKAAKQMHLQKYPITFAKINVDEHPNSAKKYNLMGFPSIFLIKDRRLYDYRGNLTKDSIMDWVKQALLPSYNNVTKIEDLNDYKANSTVLAVFYGSHDEEVFTQFDEASKFFITNPFYQFVVAADPSLAKANGQAYNGGVVIYKKYDVEEKVKNDFDAEELRVKVDTSEFPVIATFDDRFAEKVFQNMLSALFLVVKDSDACKAARAELEKVKDKIRGKVMIAVVESSSEIGKKMLKFLSLNNKALPAVRIIGPENTDVGRYPLKGEITGENIVKFVDNYRDGKLKPTFKSEDTPKTNDGPVKIIVGNTYRELVFDESKDAIVEIYASWCKYCQEFAPRYEEIGKRLAGSKDLLVGKMDGNLNDKPGGSVSSFPTILFYKANKKDHPIQYEGDFTIESVIEFVKKHATVKVSDAGPTGQFQPVAATTENVNPPAEDDDDDDDDDDEPVQKKRSTEL